MPRYEQGQSCARGTEAEQSYNSLTTLLPRTPIPDHIGELPRSSDTKVLKSSTTTPNSVPADLKPHPNRPTRCCGRNQHHQSVASHRRSPNFTTIQDAVTKSGANTRKYNRGRSAIWLGRFHTILGPRTFLCQRANEEWRQRANAKLSCGPPGLRKFSSCCTVMPKSRQSTEW